MMPVDIHQSNLHDIIRLIHILISATFMLIAIWLIIRSSIGIVKHRDYTKLDRFLAYSFLVTLYIQLLFGFLLFTKFGPMSGYDYLGAESGSRLASKRLWPIEHIVMMFFALLIATLGLILSNKAVVARDKHKKVLIYYVFSIIIIAQSLCAIYLF
jgi:heme A synthase